MTDNLISNTIKYISSLIIATAFLSCATYKPQVPGHFYENEFYENYYVGFKVIPPEDWDIGTTPKSSPKSLKHIFKTIQTESSEMLFVGGNSSERALVRCFVEGSDTTLEAYFKELFQVNEGSLITDKAVLYRSDDQEVIVWTYYVKNQGIKFHFKDFIFNPGEMKVRLSFWTLSGLYQDYEEVFDKSAKTIFLADTSSDTTKLWQERTVYDAIKNSKEMKTIEYATTKENLYFPETEKDDVCQGENKSLLWKIKGASSQAYIFGSIHLLKPEMYPLKDVVEKAFDSSSVLIFELDESDNKNTQTVKDAAKKGLYKEGETIKDHISPELYKKLVALISSMGLNSDDYIKFKPWMTAMALQLYHMKSMGLSKEFGIESYFQKKAGSRKIIGLETSSEQMNAITSLDGQSHLAYTIYGMHEAEKKMNKMLNAWECGNSRALAELFFPGRPLHFQKIL